MCKNALAAHLFALEASCQAVIAYWVWLKKNKRELEYPNAALIDALREQWPPIHWRDDYLDNPNFKGPGRRWWEEAAIAWGADLCNELIADVCETEGGYEYILFRSEKTLPLRTAKAWGWQRVLEYASAG